MAMSKQPSLVGVDVSKAELVYSLDGTPAKAFPNQRPAIRAWLRPFTAPVSLAMEATGRYHLALADEAHRRGHRVYLIDGYRLNRYRDSIGGRAKTDATDACLLARYLDREQDNLRVWAPPPKGYDTVQQLLRRRAVLVQARVSLQQSLGEVPSLKASLGALMRQMARIDLLIQKRMHQAIAQAGWLKQVQRCQGIEGIGPLTSTALTMAFHRGAFRSSDAFIAFLGLDVRVRDSGKSHGRRRLTKKGDPELRRLLYLAAMQAKRQPAWQGYYQRLIARGLAPIQALNALARKLARVAFSLMKNESHYVPRISCMET